MDINGQKTKIPSSEKLGDRLQKASSLLSFGAILMTVSLFIRMETNTKMLDSEFKLKIQEMGDALKSVRAACQVLRKDSDISKGRSFVENFLNNSASLELDNRRLVGGVVLDPYESKPIAFGCDRFYS